MPIYTFSCNCGNVFDDLLPVDTIEAICPECGKQARDKHGANVLSKAEVAPWMTNEAYDARARNRVQFIDSADTQQKLKDGRYESG